MATEERTLVRGQSYRMLTIPRFAGMTLDDAAVLGMQRLEDEGCRRVMLDRSSVSDDDWVRARRRRRLAPGLRVHPAHARVTTTRLTRPD
jgi:hypothetical protein